MGDNFGGLGYDPDPGVEGSLYIYEAISRFVEHKMNNVIQPMLGFTSLLESKIKDGDPLMKYVVPLSKSAKDAKSFTGSMLSALNAEEQTVASIDLKAFLEALLKRYLSTENLSLWDLQFEENLKVSTGPSNLYVCLREIAAYIIAVSRSGSSISVNAGSLSGSDKLPYDEVLQLELLYIPLDDDHFDEFQHEQLSSTSSFQFEVIKYLGEMMQVHVEREKCPDSGSCILRLYFPASS